MDSYPSTVLERATLAFCVDGLQAREELLVKAFIRLLDHLTHQKWLYQPPDSSAAIDLLITAPGTTQAFADRHGKLPPALLMLSNSGENGQGHLSWPLRPDALEQELNRLGGLVLTQRAAANAANSVPLFAATASGSANQAANQTAKLMRLKQWPPAHLLAGPGRLRLATLLGGKAMSLEELVSRSKQSRDLCKTFANELQQAKLLFYPTQSQPTLVGGPHTAAAHHSSAKVQQSSAATNHSKGVSSRAFVAPGLLTRIRMRLGIGS